MNWRHNFRNHIISQHQYDRLHAHDQAHYTSTYMDVNHNLEEEEDSGSSLGTVIAVAELGMELFGGDSSDSSSSVDSTPDVEFGGGDFGGAGAGGEW